MFAIPWHSMELWGVNPQRFLAAPLGGLTCLLMAVVFLPPFGPRLAAACEAAGDRLAESQRNRWIAAALFAIAVFLLSDRTLYTGDALIRNAAADTPGFLERFRQALPLELVLFERLPLALERYGIPPMLPARLLGAAAAFALGLAALQLGRQLAGRGAMLVAVACMVACGGWLVVFTGLGKPAALLCALTAIAAVCAIRTVRVGTGLAALGVSVALAISLHRAGVFLLPCWMVALALAQHPRTGARPRRSALDWTLACLPFAALALHGGRILKIGASIDAPLHLLGAASPPITHRGLDLANLSLLMCPVAIPILAGCLRPSATWARTREFAVTFSLLAPWLLLAALAHPAQGIFRDTDFFAAGGVALGVCLAWLLCGPREAFMITPQTSTAIASVCAISALQLVLCWHDPHAGLSRVRAYLCEAPRRGVADHEQGWDFLALRAFAIGDWSEAVIACDEAATLAPNPRLLIMLGIARTYSRDYPGAKQAYSRAIERSPYELAAWAGLAGIATRLGDQALADSAMAMVRMYPETHIKARELKRLIERYPEFRPAR